MTEKLIASAVRRGELHRVARGLYSKEEPDDLLTLQGLAWLHPGLVYVGDTAGFIHDLCPMTWPATAATIRGRSPDGGALLSLTSAATGPSILSKGVRVVSPIEAATAMTIANHGGLRRGLERRYQGTRGNERLAEHLAAMPPRRRAIATELLEGIVTGTASSLEQKAVRGIVDGLDGLDVTVQINAMVRGYRFDIVIPEAKVCIEIDSQTYHAPGKATTDAFLNDRWKGNAAARWGYTLLRYSDVDVNQAMPFVQAEVRDTVEFVLAHPRGRTSRAVEIPTDRQWWLWHPWKVDRFGKGRSG
ncbi:MAG TPA: hypothetical protein H9870_08065 [Candidatus Corynebacterium avicola]|uniref:DUF559 domain-containing protein n=1 Tax=Candidatus Corynebacterium avicola TaxID=2838527 RepID=A0A9D1RPY3_9CORY|nr:hypothetical protein [Candidatus Corynebacterium avicola]